nr:hypothetical protein LTR18_001066 [Exophiala xenobiotica]
MSTTDTLYREKADEKSAPLQFTVTDHDHAQIVSEARAFGGLHRSFTTRQVHVRLSLLHSVTTYTDQDLLAADHLPRLECRKRSLHRHRRGSSKRRPGHHVPAYLMVCSGVWANLQTLGEMTIAFPTSGNYVDYAGRWVDPALAFGAGYAQWLGWTAVFAAEADFFVVLVDYWTAGVVPMAAWRSATLGVLLMDFKALMSSQIAKSKPKPKPSPSQSQSPGPSTPNTSTPSSAAQQQKYLRRAELEAAREAAYAAEQARIEAERLERASKKRKLEDEEAERAAVREEKKRRLAEESRKRREQQEREEERKRRKRLGLPDLPDPSLAIEDGTHPETTTLEDIPDDELRSKLRSLNEPAALYDETHASRLKRYRTLISTAQSLSLKPKPKLSDGPIPTTLEPIPEKDMLLPTTVPAPNTPEHTFLYRQLASYFTLLLREWSIALSQRDASVKASHSGKAAATSYLQVLKDLTPLFRRFERADLEHNLLEPICQIVRCAQNRRYVEANDKYLTLSIGKAAWPIGVTMVGIHERSAREKLSESGEGKQAHIMTDEVTRKYLQSIKRCLSFAQTRWPPEDLGQLMG